MSGDHTYGEPEPTVRCPYCGTDTHADFCDVGVGMIQCGPYHCEACLASEIGGYDKPRPLTDEEKRTGWYAPQSEPGSSANVIGGTIVDHQTMNGLYRLRFKGSPDYEVPGRVEEWWSSVRKPK